MKILRLVNDDQSQRANGPELRAQSKPMVTEMARVFPLLHMSVIFARDYRATATNDDIRVANTLSDSFRIWGAGMGEISGPALDGLEPRNLDIELSNGPFDTSGFAKLHGLYNHLTRLKWPSRVRPLGP